MGMSCCATNRRNAEKLDILSSILEERNARLQFIQQEIVISSN
jgi:hypothetical protein